MNRKYGIYCAGVLMESYNDSSEAYQAFKKAVEDTGIFHELKIIKEDENAQSTIQISPSLC